MICPRVLRRACGPREATGTNGGVYTVLDTSKLDANIKRNASNAKQGAGTLPAEWTTAVQPRSPHLRATHQAAPQEETHAGSRQLANTAHTVVIGDLKHQGHDAQRQGDHRSPRQERQAEVGPQPGDPGLQLGTHEAAPVLQGRETHVNSAYTHRKPVPCANTWTKRIARPKLCSSVRPADTRPTPTATPSSTFWSGPKGPDRLPSANHSEQAPVIHTSMVRIATHYTKHQGPRTHLAVLQQGIAPDCRATGVCLLGFVVATGQITESPRSL